MKFYKPLFSIIVIILQLVLSLKDYFQLQEWKKANPELDAIINIIIHYDTLFLFVLVIGVYEMLTKPGWFKNSIRILLVSIVLGYEFSGLIPIEDFKFGVYNTAWFLTIVSVILFLFQIEKYSFGKKNDENLNKASR